MIITWDNPEEISELKMRLFKEFEMIEVLKSKQGIFILQRNYVLEMLTDVGLVDYKPDDW